MVAPPDEPSTQGGVVTNTPAPTAGAAEPLPPTDASGADVVEVDWWLRLKSEAPALAFVAGIDFTPESVVQVQPQILLEDPEPVVELVEPLPAQSPRTVVVSEVALAQRPSSSLPNAAGNVAHAIGYTLDMFSSGGDLPTVLSLALPSLLLWMGWLRFSQFDRRRRGLRLARR